MTNPDSRGLGVLIVTAITGGVVLVGARLIHSWARFVIRQVNRVAPRAVWIAVGIVDQADKTSAISISQQGRARNKPVEVGVQLWRFSAQLLTGAPDTVLESKAAHSS
jgi:hypothetical protein